MLLNSSDRRELCRQFPGDVARMRRCLDAVGLQVSDDEVVIAWSRYSDSVCASWLTLPENDAALQDILMKHLPPSPWMWQVTIQEASDGSGYQILRVPTELSEKMGWNVGDTLNITQSENEDLTLRRTTGIYEMNSNASCNHIIGFLRAEVPRGLRDERPAYALIAVSDVQNLIRNFRDYFAHYPVPKTFTEQFLYADDDEAQLDALIGRFKFCPRCGERLL